MGQISHLPPGFTSRGHELDNAIEEKGHQTGVNMVCLGTALVLLAFWVGAFQLPAAVILPIAVYFAVKSTKSVREEYLLRKNRRIDREYKKAVKFLEEPE